MIVSTYSREQDPLPYDDLLDRPSLRSDHDRAEAYHEQVHRWDAMCQHLLRGYLRRSDSVFRFFIFLTLTVALMFAMNHFVRNDFLDAFAWTLISIGFGGVFAGLFYSTLNLMFSIANVKVLKRTYQVPIGMAFPIPPTAIPRPPRGGTGQSPSQ